MNTIIRITTLAIIAAMAILTSCKQSPRQTLIGEYKISDMTTDLKMSDDDRAAWQSAIEEYKQSTVFILKGDGSMQQTIDGVTQKGTWEVLGEAIEDGEAMILKVVLEGKSTINMEIHDLSGNGFIYTQYDENTKSKTVITYSKTK